MKNPFLALLLMLCAIISAPAQISGKCIRVVDGDTYIFVTSKNDTLKIRDAFCDTPEKKNPTCILEQPYSKESSAIGAEVLLNKQFKVKLLGYSDIHKRPLGYAILPDGTYYHRYMIENGHAWSSQQKGKHYKLQLKAKAAGIGLWQNPEAVMPSEWRRKYNTHKK